MKELNIYIPNCRACPYCEWDFHGYRTGNDGWVCKKESKQIITSKEQEQGKEFKIPDFCKLEEFWEY